MFDVRIKNKKIGCYLIRIRVRTLGRCEVCHTLAYLVKRRRVTVSKLVTQHLMIDIV